MEKKGLEYAPTFKVPPPLQEKHEISMQEITGNPKHANDILTKVMARGTSNYETTRDEMEDLLEQYLPLLNKDPRRKRWDILAGRWLIPGWVGIKRRRGILRRRWSWTLTQTF